MEVSYCLWLMPEAAAFEKLSALISKLAEQHEGPEFSPHITLAVAKSSQPRRGAGRSEAAETKATEWLKETADGEKGLRLKLGQPRSGSTRHKCVMSPIEKSNDWELLHQLRDKALEIVEEFPGFSQGGGANYEPHVSLLYADMAMMDREDICQGAELKDVVSEVFFDRVELWAVPKGQPEEEWWKVGSVNLEVPEDQGVEEEEGEEDEDDWEASVDDFSAKILIEPKTSKSKPQPQEEDDWEVQSGDEEDSRGQRGDGKIDMYTELTTDNILEAHGFPSHLNDYQMDQLLEPLRKGGAATQWVDKRSALVVFRSGLKAQQANKTHKEPGFKLRLYRDASQAAKSIPLAQVVRPQRPKTTAAVANRLIKGALSQPKPKPKQPDEPTAEELAEQEAAEARAREREAKAARAPRGGGVYVPPSRRQR